MSHGTRGNAFIEVLGDRREGKHWTKGWMEKHLGIRWTAKYLILPALLRAWGLSIKCDAYWEEGDGNLEQTSHNIRHTGLNNLVGNCYDGTKLA